MKSIAPLVIFLFGLTFFTSCKSDSKKIPQEDIKVAVPVFSADSAYAYINTQLNFGPRVPNSDGHQACKNWLIEKLEGFGAEVIPQSFEAPAYNDTPLKGTNIIARFNSEVKERVLLCAHWDTRHIADKDTINQDQPIPGADDGASGVGVLLEIARQLNNKPIPMGVDIILFDAEDYGSNEPGQTYTWGLGSQHWSKNLHENNYEVKYGILLDMVGSKGARFTKEGFSRQSAPIVTNKIWSLANKMGKGSYFPQVNTGGIVDDHFFILENTDIPMVDIINLKPDQNFGDYHHTHADDLDIIDKTTLGAVGQVVLAVVYQESNKTF